MTFDRDHQAAPENGKARGARRFPGRRSRPLAMAFLSVCFLWSCGSSIGNTAGAATGGDPGPVPPMVVGMNLGNLPYWSQDRTFANLVSTSGWMMAGPAAPNGWVEMPADKYGPGGSVNIPAGNAGLLIFNRPAMPFRNLPIRCVWQGKAETVGLGGLASVTKTQANRLEGILNPKTGTGGYEIAWFEMHNQSPTDPIRNVDCREKSIPDDAIYAPEFLRFMAQFPVIRFMNWQSTNGNNQNANWDEAMNTNRLMLGADGVSVPNLIALANSVHSDPWLAIPYAASPDYIRKFARYVHDTVEPGRTIYVELGNEVWNWNFSNTGQAAEEGKKAGLSADGFQAALMRYAQKSTAAMKIWTEVFADNPKRLVRVVSTQAYCDQCANTILGFEDTAKYVDALAIAPYFYAETQKFNRSRMDEVFLALNTSVDVAIAQAVHNKAVAHQYGKRLIAYEAGHHLIFEDGEFGRAVQQDPRMGQIYTRYLDAWKKQVGDLIVLFDSTGGWGKMSFGLREYPGQPPEESPKWLAVIPFVRPMAAS